MELNPFLAPDTRRRLLLNYDGWEAHHQEFEAVFRVVFGSSRYIAQWSAVCLHKGNNEDRLVLVAQSASLEICSQRTRRVICYVKTFVNPVALVRQIEL